MIKKNNYDHLNISFRKFKWNTGEIFENTENFINKYFGITTHNWWEMTDAYATAIYTAIF